MIDEMLEITVDPYYPPDNYTPVSTRRFELLSKERVNFRVGNVTSRNTTAHSIELRKRDGNYPYNYDNKTEMFSSDKSKNHIKTSFYQENRTQIEKSEKT